MTAAVGYLCNDALLLGVMSADDKQYVVGLEVSVDNPLVVEVLATLGNLMMSE